MDNKKIVYLVLSIVLVITFVVVTTILVAYFFYFKPSIEVHSYHSRLLNNTKDENEAIDLCLNSSYPDEIIKWAESLDLCFMMVAVKFNSFEACELISAPNYEKTCVDSLNRRLGIQ